MNYLADFRFPPDLSSIYDEKLANQLANTQGAIGNLNQLSRLLPNPDLLMRPILSKEAESSSRLEGTQASMEDAYKIDVIEQTPAKKSHAQEIVNYEKAMLTGLDILEKTGFNQLLIREIHKRLMSGNVRGEGKNPGVFRQKEVWIGQEGTNKGDARYIPPDYTQVPSLIDELEKYSKEISKDINPLVACAVIHHRFESVHPFEDGNGRTGRLLISLYLIYRKLINQPILYPSGFFEKNREEYIDSLSKVDQKQEWYSWIMYFLKGLEIQAKTSLEVGIKIDNLHKADKEIIENKERSRSLSLLRVLEYMFVKPFVTAPLIHKDLAIPLQSAKRFMIILASHKIVTDMGLFLYKGKRQRIYKNDKLLKILNSI